MTVSHRGASRLALQLVAVAAVVIGMAGSAAATDGPDISGDDDAVIIKDSDTGADQSSGDDSSPIVTIPKPYKEYRYVPNCSANSVEGGDVQFAQAGWRIRTPVLKGSAERDLTVYARSSVTGIERVEVIPVVIGESGGGANAGAGD